MSKKRKCRMTPEEAAVHKEAVRLRSMTDSQLVEAFRRAAEGKAVSVAQAAHNAAEASAAANETTSGVQQLVAALSEGKCKGIKSGIAFKVAEFAEEMGIM